MEGNISNDLNTVTGSTFNLNDYTKTSSTGTAINYCPQACIHKLPCGYCTMLNRVCPMQYNMYNTTITCEAKT